MAGDKLNGLIVQILAKAHSLSNAEISTLLASLPTAVQEERDLMTASQTTKTEEATANSPATAAAANADVKAARLDGNESDAAVELTATEVAHLRGEVEKLELSNASLRRELAERDEAEGPGVANAAANAYINNLKAELYKVTVDNERLRAASNKHLHAHIHHLTNENKRLQKEVDKAAGLVSCMDKFKSLSGNIEREIQQLKRQMTNGEGEMSNKAKTLDRIESVYGTAKESLKTLERHAPGLLVHLEGPQRETARISDTNSRISQSFMQSQPNQESLQGKGSREPVCDPRPYASTSAVSRPAPLPETGLAPSLRTIPPVPTEDVSIASPVVNLGKRASPVAADPRLQVDFLLTPTKKRSAADGLGTAAAKKAKTGGDDSNSITALHKSLPAPHALVCHPCRQLNLPCDHEAPCLHCHSNARVCLYTPCPWGAYCSQESCGYLHDSQADPWDKRSKFGHRMSNFFEQFHRQVKSMRSDVAENWDQFYKARAREVVMKAAKNCEVIEIE